MTNAGRGGPRMMCRDRKAPLARQDWITPVNAAITRLIRHPLARNAVALYAVQGLNFLLPLAVLPYLLRTLSAEGYGSIVFAQALMGYAIILTEFGFNLTAARDISIARDDPVKVARIYWTTMAAKALLLAVSTALMTVVVLADGAFRRQWPVFAVCGLLAVGNVAFPTWYFQGLERLRTVAVVQAVSKCVIAAGVFLMVRSPRDLLLAAFLMSSPQLMAALTARALGIHVAPRLRFRPSWADVRAALADGTDLFLAIASTTLYLHTNAFVLGLVAGDRSVAYYGLGNRLIQAVQGLTTPVTQAVFPRASLLLASNPARAWQLIRRTAALLLPGLAAVSVLMAVMAPSLVRLVGGGKYAAAAPVLRIMAPLPLLVTAAALLSQIVMVNLGLTRTLRRIYFAVGVLNLALLPGLVLWRQAEGAATALVVAEAVGPVLMMISLRRHLRGNVA